ncbi:ABC transporter ATP-binding protein [Aquihabitans sp. G128]|uniref:ABC transporter ATP-binding protein n=1 Tax=Aquihabitans sp. G128 TaxID=2849779 RepID=UPI001C224E09|nr:ABC transporter ATP-binding protein [Aquihabitans sp. G128]QXC62821.1 ABC transporter ATP-binding protein [Aquihabitans sp. G128]
MALIKPEPESAIVVDHVSKSFRLQTDRAHSVKELITRRDRKSGADHFQALNDVSLEIPKGSMYALVGHNGSGKSTLLRCIAGIYQTTSGSVRVDGRISTLLELGAGFHPDLTGRENVYMNATILGMSKKQIDAVYDDIVAFAGVEQFIDSPVKVYSSGMYVRLGFSVAVHVDPEILIIDEVIAVGDAEFQRRCFDHLYALRKKGVTVVVVTHGLNTVESMCDGAAWLDHGVLQLTGTGPEVAAAYMDKVNAAERAEREAADEALAEELGETTASGSSKPVQVEDVQITAVEFLDGDGEVSPFGVHRDPFTLRVHYDAIRPVPSPVFGIALFSSTQVHITGTNTKIDGVDLGTISGTGHVDFAVDALPLTPGDYEITVAISDEYVQHNFDRREREYHLKVRHGGRLAPEGFMDLRGSWSVGSGG